MGGRLDLEFAVTTTFLQITATWATRGEVRIPQVEKGRGLILHLGEKETRRKETKSGKEESLWAGRLQGTGDARTLLCATDLFGWFVF